MKTFIINGYKVQANDAVQAVKLYKLVDYQPPYAIYVKKDGKWLMYSGSNSQNVDKEAFINKGYEDVTVVKNGTSPKDANNVAEIDYLTEEEKQAVEDYREAIKKTTNPKLLEVYAHILKEETEHIEELQEAKNLDDAKYDDKTKLINDLKVVLASIKANKTSEAIGLLEDVLYHL